MNTYIMGLRRLEIFLLFQWGINFRRHSDVYERHILAFKIDLRTERVKGQKKHHIKHSIR